MNYSNNHFVRRNSIINNTEDDGSSSYNDYLPHKLCPAGGLHDFEKEWLFEDYLTACLCCPCYLFKECCFGYFNRNPLGDGYNGVGCRPTGPGICSKCKQSEQQAKDSYALRQFQAHTGAGVHTSSPPRVQAPVQYDVTHQMVYRPQMTFAPQTQIHPSTIFNPNGDGRNLLNNLSSTSHDQSIYPSSGQFINYSQFQNNRVMGPNFDNRNYHHNYLS
ncbi:2717_t:CDS:2 [Funneliformis caledonium]|uniref:2717_t:CDS:1 n=1 Tax=Funneliformis caledonium TaxID=1117310 RepID=A0A9N9BI52_9GLOM|nr:2717_t:CDS:2 [Funneliformis caledonium]